MKAEKRWQEIPIGGYRWLKDVEACYAFYADGVIVYVGQTFWLKTRMKQHDCRHGYGKGEFWTPWGLLANGKIKVFLPKRYGESLMVEARLIRRLKPIFNIRGKR